MKIYLANYQPDRSGGGWSFARNFTKGIAEHLSNYDESDIYFVTSASMVSRDDFLKAKRDKKKIVLRVDNILRPSRNRGGGMTHMKEYAEAADLVVYQSADAYRRLSNYLNKNGSIILNGTDESIFKPSKSLPPANTFLYSRFNRDETKNWEVARDYFSSTSRENKLGIVGQFSPELQEYKFDFFDNENFTFFGAVDNPVQMADIYRMHSKLIYTYYHDACSNTLIEALMCGLSIIFPDTYFQKGSANEITTLWELYGDSYFGLTRMCTEYLNAMEKL